MDGFEKRRNDKKKAILQTALALFDQFGFDKVTVSEIADKAHVSKVSIYNFFESKDNLRRIIIKELLDQSLQKIQGLIANEGDFIEKIKKYIEIRTWYYGRYSLQFFFDAIEGDPEIRRYLDDYNAFNKRLAMDFINEGKRRGIFSSKVSDTAIQVCIDMFQSYFLHNSDIRETFERNPKLAQEVNTLFLNGLTQRGC